MVKKRIYIIHYFVYLPKMGMQRRPLIFKNQLFNMNFFALLKTTQTYYVCSYFELVDPSQTIYITLRILTNSLSGIWQPLNASKQC